jgi:hypothetical protein
MTNHAAEVEKHYGCSCSQCRETYERHQRQGNPYYRAPHMSGAEREAELYQRCRRDPRARDPFDDGAAGW